MKIVPIVLMLVAVVGANYYVVQRLVRMMPFSTTGQVVIVVLAVLLFLTPFLAILGGNAIPSAVTGVLYRVGTAWLIVFLYLLIAISLLDIVRLTNIFPIGKYMTHSWVGGISLAVVVGGILTIGYVRYTKKVRVEIDVQTNKQLERPLKVVGISDLHLGYGIGAAEFDSWIELINKEKADVVLIAGDVIDNSIRPLYEAGMQHLFGRIESRYGVFAVPGNHEYISDLTGSERFMRDAGVTLLRDSVALVDNRFYIVGRDDLTNSRRKEVAELTAGLDADKPILMLDHQPYQLENAAVGGVDFQLSGHTHGGQIWPITWVTQRIFEKSHGYLRKGNAHIYVSSGLGIWGGKFRLGSRSEYVIINIK